MPKHCVIAISIFSKVEITVNDENDNDPAFSAATAEYLLVETAQMGTILTPVEVATDKDKGSNSMITYTATGDAIPNVFNVNSTTGYIELVGTLNFEMKKIYNFVVTAQDGGVSPKSTSIDIIVEVMDFNDNAPEFDTNLYQELVSEVK